MNHVLSMAQCELTTAALLEACQTAQASGVTGLDRETAVWTSIG